MEGRGNDWGGGGDGERRWVNILPHRRRWPPSSSWSYIPLSSRILQQSLVFPLSVPSLPPSLLFHHFFVFPFSLTYVNFFSYHPSPLLFPPYLRHLPTLFLPSVSTLPSISLSSSLPYIPSLTHPPSPASLRCFRQVPFKSFFFHVPLRHFY